METNEIRNNEEVIEMAAEEVTKVGSEGMFTMAAGVGLTILAGVIVYKYVGKPMIAKIKDHREQKKKDQGGFDGEIIEGEIVSEKE